MTTDLDTLSERVSDLEQCIGDFQTIFSCLQEALTERAGRTGPLCPPYCAHGIVDDYEDPLTVAERVSDIRKCIGDIDVVFQALAAILARTPGPLCPPYCAHPVEGEERQG